MDDINSDISAGRSIAIKTPGVTAYLSRGPICSHLFRLAFVEMGKYVRQKEFGKPSENWKENIVMAFGVTVFFSHSAV